MPEFICAYIGLGSNLANPKKQLQQALIALRSHRDIAQLTCSPWYQNPAIGSDAQPDYINAVAKISTCLAPLTLLQTLQAIEDEQGRTRVQRWGARTLDLDILLYGEVQIHSPRLTIPHPELSKRRFVLQPLVDLCPALRLPDGHAIADLLQNCELSNLQPVASPQ